MVGTILGLKAGAVVMAAAVSFGVAHAVAPGAVHPNNKTGGPLYTSTTGGKINGTWQWDPFGPGKNGAPGYGGWQFDATLTDTVCSDGNNMKSEAAPESYGYSEFYGIQCKSKQQDYVVYDYQETLTLHARFKICRDRGFPEPDNCSPTYYYTR